MYHHQGVHRGRDMKEFFDDGSFKILIQDNVCYLRVDLDKVTRHISRSPSMLKKNEARSAAYQVKKICKPGDFLDMDRIKGGVPIRYLYLAKPDVKSFVLFSEEMNDLYMVMFVFKNTPPFH